jgi:hypothetical protein
MHLIYLVLFRRKTFPVYANLHNVSHFAQYTFDGGAHRTKIDVQKEGNFSFCVDEYCTFYSAVLNHQLVTLRIQKDTEYCRYKKT